MYEKEGFLELGVSPITAPDKPTYIELDFVKGAPVALDGKKMSAKEIILALNKVFRKKLYHLALFIILPHYI